MRQAVVAVEMLYLCFEEVDLRYSMHFVQMLLFFFGFLLIIFFKYNTGSYCLQSSRHVFWVNSVVYVMHLCQRARKTNIVFNLNRTIGGGGGEAEYQYCCEL